MPVPDPSSGLARPLQAKDLKELEYVEYHCENLGMTWSLLGEYAPVDDYLFDNNVEIINGKLRIACGSGGKLGIVSFFPPCRAFEEKRELNFAFSSRAASDSQMALE